METDDVVQDPGGPHGSIPVLQFAGAVNGPGPMPVSAGQALLVTVEFGCPADPPSASSLPEWPCRDSLRRVASRSPRRPRWGRSEAISLDSPPMLPGGNATFHFRISSSRGRDVPISFYFRTASAPQFSALAQSGTVPSGGNIDLAVSVGCTVGTPEAATRSGLSDPRAGWFPGFRFSPGPRHRSLHTVQVFTDLSGDFTLLKGDDALCEVRVVISGSPRNLLHRTVLSRPGSR